MASVTRPTVMIRGGSIDIFVRAWLRFQLWQLVNVGNVMNEAGDEMLQLRQLGLQVFSVT